MVAGVKKRSIPIIWAIRSIRSGITIFNGTRKVVNKLN
jgi:hypothetical protein